MGKKNKKVSAAVEERRKRKSNTIQTVKNNPFEVRLNRLKHNVVGKKVKTDKGIPGVSRSKANEKRKKTLLKEYKQRFKNNVIIDRRFGEFDESLTAEEKMLKRFTLEKQKHHEKSNLYNLDDEEDLTHYGQSLSTIDNFDDAGLKFTDDEDDMIGSNVDDHFGGGLLTKKKTNKDDDENDENNQKRKLTKQEIMDEIVANSKKKKFERQQIQEQAFELTQQIDTQLGEIRSLLLVKKDDKKPEKKELDDYDKTISELRFEANAAKASDRMKTEEEIAKEEMKRLEHLERERRLRMLGMEKEEEYHESADAIIETKKKKDERYEVKYKDGKIVLPDSVQNLFGIEPGITEENLEEEEEEESGDEGDEENESESDYKDIFSENEENENEGGEDSDKDAKDHENYVNKKTVKKSKVPKQKSKDDGTELPFVYNAPETLQDLLDYTKDRLDEEVLVILNRIKKCNHIKLGIKNKPKMEVFFQIIMEYIDHLCKEDRPRLKLISNMASFLQQLMGDVTTFGNEYFSKKIKNILKRIVLRVKVKGASGMFPTLKELVFFQVVFIIYPTSDLNHVITTPCLFTMVMVLSKAHFHNIKDVISGLFLLNIVLNYIKESKRYIPELITFIAKVLYQCAQTKKYMKNISGAILNLRKSEKDFLLLTQKCSHEGMHIKPLNISKTLASSVQPESLEDENIKLSCIQNILNLSKKICELYKDLPTFHEVFEPCLSLLQRLPVDLYPSCLKTLHTDLVSQMGAKSNTKHAPLKLQTRKPIPLPLLEPSFDENYEVRSKRRAGDKNKNELEKLKYKHKKETKGAMREIRKDAHFLAKEQLKETLDKDAARRRKVKELERDLANERHEIKQMEKMNRKR